MEFEIWLYIVDDNLNKFISAAYSHLNIEPQPSIIYKYISTALEDQRKQVSDDTISTMHASRAPSQY